jgi:hypothetical protein
MAVKIFLSVSLLLWLLSFCSDCGPQGVNASPSSKTFANRLDVLKTLYPRKTSVINQTLSEDQKPNPKVIEFVELLYTGTDFPDRPGSNIEVAATYSGGWIVASLYAVVDWLGTLQAIVVSGEPGEEYWSVTLEAPNGLIAVDYEIIVRIFRVVSITVIKLSYVGTCAGIAHSV